MRGCLARLSLEAGAGVALASPCKSSFAQNEYFIFKFFQKSRQNLLAPPVSAATAAVIMGSAELAMLPSSPSFAATLGGAVNSHILVVDARKTANLKHEGNGTR